MTKPRIVRVQLSGFAKNCSTRLSVYRKHPSITFISFHYSMLRPGPLQELPLERFIPTHPYTPSKSDRSHKRPLSPGGPNSYSPTKRRILNSEGIFASEKSCKTFMSSGNGWKASSARRVSPTYHILSGDSTNTEVSNTSPIRPVAVPIVIPRKLPPPPDPQSIHYPGFVVFQDAHITIYPADFTPERVSDAETHTDLFKENLPLRRKTLPMATLQTLKFDVTPLARSKPATGTPSRVISSCSPMKIDARKKLRRMMEEDDLDEEENGDHQ